MSRGVLEDLTQRQLVSMDAKIQLLNSSWTEFILKIEEGEGVMGRFATAFIEGLTSMIVAITEFGDVVENDLFSSLKDGTKTVEDLDLELIRLNATITASGRAATRQKEAIREQVNEIKEAKEEFAEWLEIQEAGRKILETGIGVPELTEKLKELSF